MARNPAYTIPAILLVLVGLVLVVWSGVAFLTHDVPFDPQDRYEARDAYTLQNQVYRFNELSPGAQNLTRAAFESEIVTGSPVPPAFDGNRAVEDSADRPDHAERYVSYYIYYQGEFRKLEVSANRSTVTLVNTSIEELDRELYVYSELTDREQDVVDRAVDNDREIYGPEAADLPHFEASDVPRMQGHYVVYREGHVHEISVDPGTGPLFWLNVLVPTFLVGAISLGFGLRSYARSLTMAPTAVLFGLLATIGLTVVVNPNLVEPIEQPEYLLVVPLVVTTTVYLLMALLQRVQHRRT